MEYGSLSDKTKFQNTLFYFREIDGKLPSSEFRGEDRKHTAKINALKRRIRKLNKKAGGHIKEYHLKWNGNGFDGVKEFAHMLAEDIKEMLMPQWAEYEKLTPFQKERMAHHTFIGEKSEMFRARKKEADELIKQIKTEPVTIIKGAVGSGKSTLFSYIAKNMESAEWTVLPFVSGLTSQSDSTFEIMANAVYFLEDKLGIKEHYIDEIDHMTQQRKIHSIEEWREKLAELCWRYTETGQKLLIMVDAADQLTQSEERDKLYFIPTNVNENIHFTMTCTTDFETNDWNFYTLKEISAEDKRDVILGTLSRIHRELSKNVVDKMVDEEASSNPLYLSLLIQRLTMMNIMDFEKISKDKKQMAAIEKQHIEIIKHCPKNPEEMSAELLLEAGRRIENSELVSRAGQYLAVSREGLRKKDLAKLLGEIWTEVDFSHFINYMYDSFMLRDDGRYDFTHKSIRAGFLKKCDREKLNAEIFSHLKALPHNDPVRISEIVYHTIKADGKHFFAEYIIEHEYDDNKSCINQAALDTYKQCISDKGKWICDILGSFDLFESDNESRGFTNFINFELRKNFIETLDELYIQLAVLKANKSFAEYLDNELKTNKTKRDVLLSNEFLGGIYQDIGGMENLMKALELYQKRLKLAEQIFKTENTIESKRDLSISYERVGEIYERLAGEENLTKALKLYQKGLELAKQFYTIQNSNEGQRDLAISYENIANIYVKLGNKENLYKALKLYKKSLLLREVLFKNENTNEIKRELSISYNKLANTYELIGEEKNIKKALNFYRKSLNIRKQLYLSENTNESKKDLGIVYGYIGQVYEQFGDNDKLKKALESHQKALRIFEELEEICGTIEIHDYLAVSLYKVAINPYTDSKDKKALLTLAVHIAGNLDDELPNERYDNLLISIYEEWAKIDE